MSEMNEAATEIDFDRKHLQRLQDERDELRRKYEEAVLAGDRLAWEKAELELRYDQSLKLLNLFRRANRELVKQVDEFIEGLPPDPMLGVPVRVDDIRKVKVPHSK